MTAVGTTPLLDPVPPRGPIAQALHDSHPARTQAQLARTGALMLPLGILVIAFGWSTSRGAPLDEQSAELAWAGFGGLAITCVGACLYVGSWLARLAIDGHEASDRLAATALLLADAIANAPTGGGHGLNADSLRVTAAGGVTVHRRDCALIVHRNDLSLVSTHQPDHVRCRVCQP